MPHPLRFAAALALVAGATTPGCYRVHERVDPPRPIDAGPLGDAWAPDAGPCARPLPCTCRTLSMPGTCDALGLSACCPIVGPLAPPDLPIA